MTAIHTCPDGEAAFSQAAALVADLLRRAQDNGRTATLVLPGGTTVRRFVSRLSAQAPDWSRITVILADERWVAVDDPASNEGLLRSLLPVGTRVVGLKTAAADPTTGLAQAAERLRPLGPPFDVAFFGVGGDGHIASLFPHGTELTAEGVVVAALSPLAPHHRISLGLGTLLSCSHLVSVMADDKRPVLEQALAAGPAEDMPVRFLLRQQDVPVTIFAT